MTWSPADRWDQHLLDGGSQYTKDHPPKALVYLEEYDDLEEARTREKQIKGWSRKKKQKLISGEWGKWE